jgi:hypothetical protein
MILQRIVEDRAIPGHNQDVKTGSVAKSQIIMCATSMRHRDCILQGSYGTPYTGIDGAHGVSIILRP